MKIKMLAASALLAALLPSVAAARPDGFYLGVHGGGIDSDSSASGPGLNLGYQGDNGWGVHAEGTRASVGGFGGVFATYRTEGTAYALFKAGAVGGRHASGAAAGVGVGVDLGDHVNLELDVNKYGAENAGHLRVVFSF